MAIHAVFDAQVSFTTDQELAPVTMYLSERIEPLYMNNHGQEANACIDELLVRYRDNPKVQAFLYAYRGGRNSKLNIDHVLAREDFKRFHALRETIK